MLIKGRQKQKLCFPAILYPVNDKMRYTRGAIWSCNSCYIISNVKKPIDFMADSIWSASKIFGKDVNRLGPIIDSLVNLVCRVNLNNL